VVLFWYVEIQKEKVMKKIAVVGVSLLSVASFLADSSALDVRGLAQNELHVDFLNKTPQRKLINLLGENSISSEVVADVVVFYQPSFFKKYGEYDALNRINEWFNLANESYKAHGTNYKLSISDVIPVESIGDEVPFEDVIGSDGNIISDGAEYLFSLAVLNAGTPEFAAYQTKWKGDLVVYVREKRAEDTILGRAGIGGEMSSVLDDDTDPKLFTTLAHEIGHNIGMNHEAAKAYVGPDYARAWECGGKQTIMYSASSKANTLHHYSSPKMFNGGVACGDEDVADNARILDENFSGVTNRRTGVEILGSVSFDSLSLVANEGEGVKVKLVRNGDLSQSASVKVFAKNGTAKWGSDYTNAYVLAEFAAGSSVANVVFPLVEDSLVEGEEEFSLVLQYPYRLSVNSAEVASVVISETGNVVDAGVFSLSGPQEVVEGGEATFVVSRIGGRGGAVVYARTISGTAYGSADYVDLNVPLAFSDGEQEKSFVINTIDNSIVDGNRVFDIVIESSSGSIAFNVDRLTVNLLDDDVPEVPISSVFSLSADKLSVSESVGVVNVRITRSSALADSASVRIFTEDGTQKGGIDFVQLNEVVNFEAGESEKVVPIKIIDDGNVESGSGTFKVKIEAQGFEIDKSELVITIVDNDKETPGNGDDNSNPEEGSSSGGGMGWFFVLSLSLVAFLRKNGKTDFNANKKLI